MSCQKIEYKIFI